MKRNFQLLLFSGFFLIQPSLKNFRINSDSNASKLSSFVYINGFVNSITDGGKCNTFGYDKYVQNSDPNAAYNVTVKVEEYKAGSGSKEFQKVVSVPAGGKTYVGCSVSPATDGPSYTYTVIGESKQ